MKKVIIAQRNNDLKLLSYFSKEGEKNSISGAGKYRVIIKCQGGFITSSVIESSSALNVLRSYKPKAILSIARIMNNGDNDFDITVFARNGKKIWITEDMLSEITVGDINNGFSNTALYSQYQYSSVKATSWASKAYVMNEEKQMVA
jgi:hypothetical protein